MMMGGYYNRFVIINGDLRSYYNIFSVLNI